MSTSATSKEELIGLMDYYSSEVDEARDTAINTPHRAVGDDDVLVQSQREQHQEEREIQLTIWQLERLLQNRKASPDQISELYNRLPSPGAARLKQRTLEYLLHRMSHVPYKSHSSMLRYLHIITDMRSAGRHVPVGAWTTAIAFAGRCVKRITASEIESALSLWKQMESQAGVRANEVTFNVLFDVASKAGKFVLAEMLLREMKTRGHGFNRYMRVNLMYYYGLRGDGTGVRRAYKELVESGEIVDTAVMSCAVASLLKAGEPVAAEQVFERAKRLHAGKGGASPLPPHQWQHRKDLGRSLMKAAVRLRDATPEERKQVQDATPLAPGLHVYKVLVYYHAVTAGDVDRVSTLVDEMAWYQIPVQGAIFLYLFKGFATHGGLLYSGWTRQRLELTFQAFLDAVEEARGPESPADTSEDKTAQDSATLDATQPTPEISADEAASSEMPESNTPRLPSRQICFDQSFDANTHPSDVTHLSRAACCLCLSAYMRVVDATRAGEVWSQLQLLWAPKADDREAVETYLVELQQRRERWDRFGPRIGRVRSGMSSWLR